MCPADDVAVFLLVLFRTGGKTPDPKLQVRSYMDVMREQHLSKEEVRGHTLIRQGFIRGMLELCRESTGLLKLSG